MHSSFLVTKVFTGCRPFLQNPRLRLPTPGTSHPSEPALSLPHANHAYQPRVAVVIYTLQIYPGPSTTLSRDVVCRMESLGIDLKALYFPIPVPLFRRGLVDQENECSLPPYHLRIPIYSNRFFLSKGLLMVRLQRVSSCITSSFEAVQWTRHCSYQIAKTFSVPQLYLGQMSARKTFLVYSYTVLGTFTVQPPDSAYPQAAINPEVRDNTSYDLITHSRCR